MVMYRSKNRKMSPVWRSPVDYLSTTTRQTHCPHLLCEIFSFKGNSHLLAGFWKNGWLVGKSCLSVCPRYNSHQLAGNDRIATKLVHDGPQVNLHPGLLYVLTVYPAKRWAPRVRAHEWRHMTSSGHLTSYVYMNDSADSLSFIHAAAAENQRVGKTRHRSIYSADRHQTDTTYHQPTSQPASQSDSTQLKAGK